MIQPFNADSLDGMNESIEIDRSQAPYMLSQHATNVDIWTHNTHRHNIKNQGRRTTYAGWWPCSRKAPRRCWPRGTRRRWGSTTTTCRGTGEGLVVFDGWMGLVCFVSWHVEALTPTFSSSIHHHQR